MELVHIARAPIDVFLFVWFPKKQGCNVVQVTRRGFSSTLNFKCLNCDRKSSRAQPQAKTTCASSYGAQFLISNIRVSRNTQFNEFPKFTKHADCHRRSSLRYVSPRTTGVENVFNQFRDPNSVTGATNTFL